MDPRVSTPAIGLAQQFTLSKQLYDGILAAQKTLAEVRALRSSSARLSAERTDSPACPEPCRGERLALQTLDQKLAALEGQAGGGRGGPSTGSGQAPAETLNSTVGTLNQLMGMLQGADVAPTRQLVAAIGQRRAALKKLLARWNALKAEAKTLNLL